MTVPAPYPLPVVSGWQVTDWLDRSQFATTDDTGTATITLGPVPDNERWQLTHCVAGCLSTAIPTLRHYLDDVSDTNLRDGTDDGRFGVSEWPMGLWIPPGRALLSVWTGADPGVKAVLTVQATIYRRTS